MNTPTYNIGNARSASLFTHTKKGNSVMNIIVYTKTNCPNCLAAKQLLESKGLEYIDVDVERGTRWENMLKEYPDARQMPQIFINDQRVGGLAGLQAALKKLEEIDGHYKN
jgi:glutaredoxin 3